MVRDFCCHSTDVQSRSIRKFRKLTHPDASIDQYMFVLIISTFNLTALILCTSNTMLEGSRPKLVAKDCLYPTSLMIIPQAPTFYTHPNDQFDRYMFVLSISPLTMMALISCTSNTSYARQKSASNRQRNMFWNFGCYGTTCNASVHSKHRNFTILMPPLINICLF